MQPSYTASIAGGGIAGLAAGYMLGIINALLGRLDAHFGLGGILIMTPDLVSGLTAAAGAYIVARMHITAAAAGTPAAITASAGVALPPPSKS